MGFGDIQTYKLFLCIYFQHKESKYTYPVYQALEYVEYIPCKWVRIL